MNRSWSGVMIGALVFEDFAIGPPSKGSVSPPFSAALFTETLDISWTDLVTLSSNPLKLLARPAGIEPAFPP
jgi:hypothetical protein